MPVQVSCRQAQQCSRGMRRSHQLLKPTRVCSRVPTGSVNIGVHMCSSSSAPVSSLPVARLFASCGIALSRLLHFCSACLLQSPAWAPCLHSNSAPAQGVALGQRWVLLVPWCNGCRLLSGGRQGCVWSACRVTRYRKVCRILLGYTCWAAVTSEGGSCRRDMCSVQALCT